MGLTNFDNGVTSFGAVLPSGYPLTGAPHLWVQANYGNDGNTGKSPDSPFLTMARAFQFVESGGVIHFTGKVKEQLVSPAGIFDVTIIGEQTRPRHADDHTSDSLAVLGGRMAATWAAPDSPVSGQALLRIQQQGWHLHNILWAGFTTGTPASVEIVRNAASGDDERDGSHAWISSCRFAGGSKGVRFGATSYTENNFDCLIEDNEFSDCVIGIGGAQCYRLVLRGNRFLTNTNHIVLATTQCTLIDNVFQNHTTDSINLTGGGGLNVITKNYLSGTYSVVGGYTKSNANDEWAGNFNTLAGGITVAAPA